MNSQKEYSLTLLLHPQVNEKEKQEAFDTVVKWIEDGKGEVKEIKHEERQRLSYEIQHTQVAHFSSFRFAAKDVDPKEVKERLERLKKVMRVRVFAPKKQEEGLKSLREVMAQKAAEKAAAGAREMAQKAAEKAAAEPPKDLDTKIEEALKEEVL